MRKAWTPILLRFRVSAVTDKIGVYAILLPFMALDGSIFPEFGQHLPTEQLYFPPGTSIFEVLADLKLSSLMPQSQAFRNQLFFRWQTSLSHIYYKNLVAFRTNMT